MPDWKIIAEQALHVLNIVLAAYFIAGNGTYTLLMLVSLGSVWVNSQKAGWEGPNHQLESPMNPPVTIIMPAFNEEETIVESVRSTLKAEYPGLEVLVVDDGSTDATLERLIAAFELVQVDRLYRPVVPTQPIRAFYVGRGITNLTVISKGHGGKPDALNSGLNLCRTPYFCTLDADCILERNALLRLMRPVLASPVNTAVSSGVVRVLNGCEVDKGQVARVGLPRKVLERFQVVEYLRSFLFGRTGWDLVGGTLIVSGAFALFHRQTVVEAEGFSTDTVTEDAELILRLHRWAREQKRRLRVSFSSDPVCWVQCPSSVSMLARQRRRWQMGLCQTLWKNSFMHFNRHYGVVGLLSFPFHTYIEALGAGVEFVGYLAVPLARLSGLTLPPLYLSILILGLTYSAFLSIGSVVLEDLTHRRYSSMRDFFTLLLYAVLENFGYRQLILWFRLQGYLKFHAGSRQWEKVVHGAPNR
jgi:cellulose synthase/poly-beta-1,6-N-acetylglucosamine synthase-like glycosyltransferase